MFYGQFELDKFIYENFFKEVRNGFFVECGAFDGLTECTCKFFEESMGWHGMNIEPTPYGYSKLIQNRPNCINENCALSSKNDKAIFTNAIHPNLGLHFGNGSISHSKEHKQLLINEGCSFESFEVSCNRFENLYKKHNLSNIDLFVLDVEGHELDALQGILSLPEAGLPKVFCIEYTISGLDQISAMLSLYYTFVGTYAHNALYKRK